MRESPTPNLVFEASTRIFHQSRMVHTRANPKSVPDLVDPARMLEDAAIFPDFFVVNPL